MTYGLRNTCVSTAGAAAEAEAGRDAEQSIIILSSSHGTQFGCSEKTPSNCRRAAGCCTAQVAGVVRPIVACLLRDHEIAQTVIAAIVAVCRDS